MFVILLVAFIDLVGFGTIIPLLPFYGLHFGASPLTVTMLLASYSALQLLAAPMWGWLSDWVGRKPILLLSLTASVLAYQGMARADELWMLFAARALQGLSAGNIAVAQAYIADITTPANRARAMGFLGAALGLGFIVGPAIGGRLAGASPTAFTAAEPSYAAAFLSLTALIVACIALKESHPHERRIAGREKLGRLTLLADAFSRPRLRKLLLVSFVVTASFSTLETTFALWALGRFGWGPWMTSNAFIGIGIVMVLVQGGPVRPLNRRLGSDRLLLAGAFLIAFGMALFASADTVIMMAVSLGLLSVGMGLAQPALSSLVSLEAAFFEYGSILGINQSVGSAGRLIGPLAGGLAITQWGLGAPYIVATVAMVIALWLAAAFVRSGRASAVVMPLASDDAVAPAAARGGGPARSPEPVRASVERSGVSA
jgi:DHA1 family tetracycline resistance protein-like MFS transporter